MKFITTIISIVCTTSLVVAQSTTEAFEKYRGGHLTGTARYNGLSGAFGALGGDLSALSDNPAGAAVFSSSHGAVTLSQGGSRFLTSYDGNSALKTDQANLNLNQIGGVLVFNKNTDTNTLERVVLGFNYALSQDHKSHYRLQGDLNTSIGSYFAEQANGYFPENISRFEGETYRDAYINIGDSSGYGRRGQEAFLGYSSYLISPSEDSDDIYDSELATTSSFQDIEVRQSGSNSKTSLNLATSYSSGWHLGANLNIHASSYQKEMVFYEDNTYANVTYIQDETTSSTGISLGVGALYRTGKNFRFGLSYQTPTWLSVNTEIDQRIITNFTTPIEIDDNQDGVVEDSFSSLTIDPGVYYLYSEYQLRIPSKTMLSAAYVIADKALISGQYTYQNLSNIKYGEGFQGASQLNESIAAYYKPIHDFRLGTEFRAQNWKFRAGTQFTSSPLESRVNSSSLDSGFSLGLGYAWKRYKLDLAYNHYQRTRNFTPFENGSYFPTATIEEKGDLVSLTFNVGF